jgi:hypothetical protein
VGQYPFKLPKYRYYKYALHAICWIMFTVLVEKLTDQSTDGRNAVRAAAT